MFKFSVENGGPPLPSVVTARVISRVIALVMTCVIISVLIRVMIRVMIRVIAGVIACVLFVGLFPGSLRTTALGPQDNFFYPRIKFFICGSKIEDLSAYSPAAFKPQP